MKRVYVVFDDEFDDVDILLVPDDIADNIERVVWEFNQWLRIPENRSRFVVKIINGYGILSINTEEFLWWLNHVRIDTTQKATILTQHTKLVSDYPRAEF